MNKPQLLTMTEIAFLTSLPDLELAALLGEYPKHEAAAILRQLTESAGSDNDIERKRDKRSRAAEVVINPVADMVRRKDCLADPVLFLKTYNAKGDKGFTTDFAVHHLRMIEAIHERAISGGDKAIAAPRGDGKSTIATWMMIYVILSGLVRSSVIIAATRKHAQKIFKDIKAAFLFNDMLAGDFPEISDCVRDLDGAPQRAAKQHVDGEKTRIVWTQDDISFPFVPGSIYGGARIAYFGLESAIRGGRYEFALIDDPETREVAFSDEGNQKIEDMIDSDVAGLAYPDSTISRVILTTVQNRRCYSFRVTDPKQKPTFAGERFGVLSSWPTDREKWDDYISMRQIGQESGDKDGLGALQFFLDNREAMELGAVVTNASRFNHRLNDDGVAIEVSALQAFFNRIADWGLSRAMAELQNDPEEEETEQTIGLTAGKVQSRITGLRRNELPLADGLKVTIGIDIGNWYGHWVKVAWYGSAIGSIVDYGVMEVPGMVNDANVETINRLMIPALHQWRSNMLAENPPEFCLLDSGSGLHKDAVYEFVRQAGGTPFAASKGWDRGRFFMGKDGLDRRLFQECYAGHQPTEKLWLYHVNTEFWKQWAHERFATPTFDDSQQRNDGTLGLFAVPENPKEHLSFAKHIVSEERESLFIPGKGMQVKWKVNNKNNHWLDAMALACAAAGVLGVRLIPRKETSQPANREKQIVKPTGKPFLSRPGGWVKGAMGK